MQTIGAWVLHPQPAPCGSLPCMEPCWPGSEVQSRAHKKGRVSNAWSLLYLVRLAVTETPISQIARTGLHPDPRCKTVRPINIWHPPVCPPCDCNFDPQRHRTAGITFAPCHVLAFCDSFYKPNKWFAIAPGTPKEMVQSRKIRFYYSEIACIGDPRVLETSLIL